MLSLFYSKGGGSNVIHKLPQICFFFCKISHLTRMNGLVCSEIIFITLLLFYIERAEEQIQRLSNSTEICDRKVSQAKTKALSPAWSKSKYLHIWTRGVRMIPPPRIRPFLNRYWCFFVDINFKGFKDDLQRKNMFWPFLGPYRRPICFENGIF